VWRRNKKPPTKAYLTRVDRLVLRTLLIDGLFLAITFTAAPRTAFRALAVRGDWMVDGYDGPIARGIRRVTLGIADRFERRWHVRDARYGESDAAPDELPPPDATTGWPLPAEPDALVTSIPESEQTSVDAVGKWFAARITDQKRLVKALHDFTVLRLSYDESALSRIEAKDWEHVPSQEADAVFARKTAVCAGYAHLMSALGKAAGVQIDYVTGYARDSMLQVSASTDTNVLAGLQGYAHAWNAAKIDGHWLLIDATWDDPKDPTAPIESTYLFTPPQLFAYQHLPESTAWQLLATPLTPGDFVRQPLLTPIAGRLGLTLEEPTRSQVTVDGELTIEVKNPYHARLSAYATAPGSHDDSGKQRCELSGDDRVEITCKLERGQYEVRLFGATAASTGSLDYFGSIQVNAR
jgi:transglutaminase-like putative cysteine protease